MLLTLVERYDPVTNEWETLNPLSVPREMEPLLLFYKIKSMQLVELV